MTVEPQRIGIDLTALTWQRYQKAQKTRGVAESTLQNNDWHLPALQERLRMPLQEAKPIDLQGLVDDLGEEGKTRGTIKTYGQVLTGFYSWLELMAGKNEYGQPNLPNPMKAITLPEPRKKTKPALTVDQFQRVLDHFKETFPIAYEITVLIYTYALRIGELLPRQYDQRGRNPKKVEGHIRFDHVIDPETDRKVPVVTFRVKGKGGKRPEPKQKTLPLKRGDRAKILRLLREPITIDAYRKRLHQAQKALGIKLKNSIGESIKLTPHIIRHSRATHAGRKAWTMYGGDRERAGVGITKLLGHDDIKQALTYVHPPPSELSELMES